jgi:hypothetical protein
VIEESGEAAIVADPGPIFKVQARILAIRWLRKPKTLINLGIDPEFIQI